jgi:Mor family transcriptional regulator
VAADGTEGYTSREDRIVAEFGDGLDVGGIAFRYGLTVAQVYAVVEREVGTADQGRPSPPSHYPPPGYHAPPPPAPNHYAPRPTGPQGHYSPQPTQGYYGPPAYPVQPPSPEQYASPAAYAPPSYAAHEQGFQSSQGFLDDDAIVAEYGAGNDVEWIARKHGINVKRVYEVVQRIVEDDPRPPAGPISS